MNITFPPIRSAAFDDYDDVHLVHLEDVADEQEAVDFLRNEYPVSTVLSCAYGINNCTVWFIP